MGLLDNFVQGYMSRMGGGRGNSGQAEAMQAKQTATAYQQLQDVMKQDYDMQKAEAQKNGQEWKMPSPTERMNDQIQAMVLSGDPNLQSRGLAMMDVPKDDETTTLEKTARALGWTPQQVFDKMHPGAASTRINVNLPKMDQPLSLEDLQKLQLPGGKPVPIGSSMREAGQMGANIAQTKEQADKGSAAEISSGAIKQLGENLNPTSTVKDTVVESLRNAPGLIGQVSSVAAGAAGIPTNPAAVKFIQAQSQASSQLLKIMSGAAATDPEYDRIKALFPQMTDSPTTKAIKYNTMLDQAQAIVERAKSQGVTGLPDLSTINRVPIPKNGGSKVPAAPRAAQAAQQPEVRTTKSGVKYTVE